MHVSVKSARRYAASLEKKVSQRVVRVGQTNRFKLDGLMAALDQLKDKQSAKNRRNKEVVDDESDSRQTFIIEPLNPAENRREEFDCGVPVLNDFLHLVPERKWKLELRPVSSCRRGSSGRIVGYYTLSAATIAQTELPEAILKKLPRYDAMPPTAREVGS